MDSFEKFIASSLPVLADISSHRLLVPLVLVPTLPSKDHRLWFPLSVASPAKGDLDCHDRGTSIAGGVNVGQGVTSPVGVGGVE